MKDKMMVWSIAAAVEFMAFLAIVKLSDISPYFWIADSAVLIGIIVTGRALYLSVQDKIAMHNNSKAEELKKILDNISVRNNELETDIASVTELSKANCNAIDSLTRNVETISNKLDGLSKSLSDEIRKSLEAQKKKNEALVSELSQVLTGEVSKYLEEQTNKNKVLVSQLSDANNSMTNNLVSKLDAMSQQQSERIEVSVRNAVSGYTGSFVKTNTDTQESVKKLVEAVLAYIKAGNAFNAELKKLLEASADTQNDQFNTFTNDFAGNISDLNRKLNNNFDRYSQEIGEIQKQIQTITENYEKMFGQVLENQKNMHAMTEADMELLQQLVR